MAATAAPSSPPQVRGRRPPHGEPVVDRALSLLAAFDTDHRTLSLTELSRRSQIPPSSALRLANRLVNWGALERDGAGRYCVGLRLLEIATLAPRGHGLREVALPFMHDLAEVTRQHVQLAVRDGMQAMLVERLSAHQAASVEYRTGGRLPLHSTGVGLVLLAFAPQEVREELLARPVYSEPGNRLIPAGTLRRTLADVRLKQLAVFHREDESIVSIAAPVFGRDETVVGVLGVLVPTRTAEPRRMGLAVQTAARGISRELGSRRPTDAPSSDGPRPG
ncbi:IclR family transcriptional regulator [Planomonospora sp. ID67723]|uniref:IclR family transcriptional regulator n=1 Tax=Planomonospora sp. ID67723 TaxID=2738134 RepID=UPI0027DD21BC|nr:IclR family transcriptional regulator [Planomonospora sp. ID67723]